MPDKYFVLQAKKPLEPGQPWYHIPGLKTEMMTDLDMLPPTQASRDEGPLEWLIPNTQYNQGWISRYYSKDYRILRAGQEKTVVDGVKPMEGMPEPLKTNSDTYAPEVIETETEPAEAPGTIGEPPSTPERETVKSNVSSEPIQYRSLPGAEIPDVPDGPGDIRTESVSEVKEYFRTPTDPREIKQLKSKITEKLSELEVPAPKNSTLKTLQDLLSKNL